MALYAGDAPVLAAIVRDLGSLPAPMVGSACALCGATAGGLVSQHREDCVWRRARDWVVERGSGPRPSTDEDRAQSAARLRGPGFPEPSDPTFD